MDTLKNKVDFAVIINVNNANPNGDPLNGNRPRVNYDGIGELSDVCIKRKIRNRLMHRYSELENKEKEGQAVFVQSDDNKLDDYPSLRSRAEGELEKKYWKDEKSFFDAVCAKWIDVRAFGQVFAYASEKKGEGVSIGVRGPVSIHSAFSVAPVSDRIISIQITKSVSGEGEGKKKASDTMGMKHRVDHGVYVFYGSMNPQLATKTGFADEDAKAIKQALMTLFRNDASSARPEGSMEVHKVYWWEHNSANGQYSSAKVHRLLEVKSKPDKQEPKAIGDYDIILNKLKNLNCEEIDGE
ncbi:MAG: type I-C CRISPR-associated protein Cas7/Csd2 [Deltaproteobacteria bacterium]|nr:type I-C CRISPR-associated protein Cas7/Csd2 [Deltaproteobacteria bacterium]